LRKQYDFNLRLRKEEVLRKLSNQELETMSPSEVSITWIALEGFFTLGELGYETNKMCVKPEHATERDLQGYAAFICHFLLCLYQFLVMRNSAHNKKTDSHDRLW